MSGNGQVSGYLGEDAKEELSEYCDEHDIPVSRFVTRAVNREFARVTSSRGGSDE